jgi:hypothetical protein
MTQGAFAIDPETSLITTYKQGPTTWVNTADPSKPITFDPRDLKKPLERAAFERQEFDLTKGQPAAVLVEAALRRVNNPYMQAGLLLNEVIGQMTGTTPTEAVGSAFRSAMEQNLAEQAAQGERFPRAWQNPPF